MSAKGPIVEMEHVSFAYDRTFALEDITLSVPRGDFLGVVGPNGSGKTTLLKIILGLIHPSSGTVRVFGQSPERARPLVGYVPQHAELDHGFPISAMDVVLLGRLSNRPLLGGYRQQDKRLAEEALAMVKTADLGKQQFGTLSGGQKQRVLIARALAGKPELLLLDEPTASVDGRVEEDIYDLLKKLNEHVTIILVSHDLGFISTYVRHVACVNRRLACSRTQDITGDVIEACYNGPVHMLKHKCEL